MMTLAEPMAHDFDDEYEAPRDPKPVVLVVGDAAHESNLYAAGDLRLLDRRCVAVVGSREASEEGRLMAWRVARELAGTDAAIPERTGP
jgi:hypothetical protein